MSRKPLLLFTPGAWHKPIYFSAVMSRCVAAGHEVDTLSFPSTGIVVPPGSLNEDIAVVRNKVVELSDSGKDIVIVSHSWSALPVNCALDGLSKKEREREGKPGGIAKLIFVAAFVIPEGISLFEACGNVNPPVWNIQGDVILPNDPVNYFYPELPQEEAKTWAAMLVPLGKASSFDKTTAAAYLSIPSVYVIAENDRGLLPVVQEALVKTAQEAGADMKVERIPTGHTPFLAMPDRMTEIILTSI